MTDVRPAPTARATFVKGVLGGVGAGLLTVTVPVLGVGALAIGAVAGMRLVRQGPSVRVESALVMAGALLGFGALLLYGSWQVISACDATSDFCGNANVVPILVGGIVAMLTGIVGTLWSARLVRGLRDRA